MNVLDALKGRFAAACPEWGDRAAFADAVRPSTSEKFGDYQANGCMSLAKARKLNPRELAEEVKAAVDLEPIAEPPEVAGAGFLNVRLRGEFLVGLLGSLLKDERLGLEDPERPLTVVIDYSSPNVAKPMHVGHIRSTVIGDALARMYSALGHKVIRDNHLGDWGAQFGMILWGWKNIRDDDAYARDPVAELSRLYRAVQARIKPAEAYGGNLRKVQALEAQGKAKEAGDLYAKLFAEVKIDRAEIERQIAAGREVEEAARRETVKLHSGDAKNRELWSQFMPYCLEALRRVYRRLDVAFDTEYGESFYDPMLAGVVADLQSKGFAVESNGALVVFVEGLKAPFIVRKSDGAYNYATTDLATIQFRSKEFAPDLSLYVVDTRQSEHFKALFDVAKRWGYNSTRMEHVAFGTILGLDRKPMKTRDGDTVGLESLLDEAVARARKVVDENSPDLSDEERGKVSEIVGIGAIKYADLSQNRLSDYVFDYDKMLAMNGNTATYLQYAYARTRSIFRKGNVTPEEIIAKAPAILLDHPSERALAVQMARFPESLKLAAEELKPNIFTDYLFELANRFSQFFENCPVLKADSEERKESRLALCELTGRTLRVGLGLLGIGTAERL